MTELAAKYSAALARVVVYSKWMNWVSADRFRVLNRSAKDFELFGNQP